MYWLFLVSLLNKFKLPFKKERRKAKEMLNNLDSQTGTCIAMAGDCFHEVFGGVTILLYQK